MKRCPFCAEDIQDAAIVCKHCGRNLNGSTPPVQVVQVLHARRGYVIALAVVLGGFVLLGLFGMWLEK